MKEERGREGVMGIQRN